jgi:hypothetical protein
MAVDPSIERAEPGSGNARDNRHADPILQTEANAALERWLQDQELAVRTREAERALQSAEQRYAALQTRQDVAGHRAFGCPGRSARPRRPALTGRSEQSPSGSLSVSCSRCRD